MVVTREARALRQAAQFLTLCRSVDQSVSSPTMTLSAWQPYVNAMLAYYNGDYDAKIVVHDDFGDRDEHPVAYFFRTPPDFPPLEQCALELCRGIVLDAGAGSGCDALALQQCDVSVVALEIAPELCRMMRERGVCDVRCGDINDFISEPFDTVLMMMNGLELAGTLAGLERLLERLHGLVRPGGQVIADSTDLRESHGIGLDRARRKDGRYVGEVTNQLEFGGEKGAPFPHLYVDPDTLAYYASHSGWDSTVPFEGPFGQYLAQLTH
jgi:SAM-dependent methyltransferase